jgi:hypothetical protein
MNDTTDIFDDVPAAQPAQMEPVDNDLVSVFRALSYFEIETESGVVRVEEGAFFVTLPTGRVHVLQG